MSDPASSSNAGEASGSQPEKSPEEIMREQEALVMKKYGGMQPKKKGLLMAKEQKFFDSADWAMKKEAAAKQGPAVIPEVREVEKLKPKLEPTPIPARRVSHLDPMEKLS